jgi:hypothetical protein
MRLSIDISGVPEDKRDAKFEEELLKFQASLYRDTTSLRWLFRLALHEGAHWFYSKEECTPQGPQFRYRDGEFNLVNGCIASRPEKSLEYDFIADSWKAWLAGPLAVTTLTGEPTDPEPDILAACKFLEISRDKADSMILLAELDLWSDFRDPVIVGEILEAARNYACAVFHDDTCADGVKKSGKVCGTNSDYHGDFCVDWGIKRYRIGIVQAERNVS